jgi:hypothetical protein
LASTYGTLLSSQRTDAHRNPPLGELSGQPFYLSSGPHPGQIAVAIILRGVPASTGRHYLTPSRGVLVPGWTRPGRAGALVVVPSQMLLVLLSGARPRQSAPGRGRRRGHRVQAPAGPGHSRRTGAILRPPGNRPAGAVPAVAHRLRRARRGPAPRSPGGAGPHRLGPQPRLRAGSPPAGSRSRRISRAPAQLPPDQPRTGSGRPGWSPPRASR